MSHRWLVAEFGLISGDSKTSTLGLFYLGSWSWQNGILGRAGVEEEGVELVALATVFQSHWGYDVILGGLFPD